MHYIVESKWLYYYLFRHPIDKQFAMAGVGRGRGATVPAWLAEQQAAEAAAAAAGRPPRNGTENGSHSTGVSLLAGLLVIYSLNICVRRCSMRCRDSTTTPPRSLESAAEIETKTAAPDTAENAAAAVTDTRGEAAGDAPGEIG